jgi:hypothetical protein
MPGPAFSRQPLKPKESHEREEKQHTAQEERQGPAQAVAISHYLGSPPGFALGPQWHRVNADSGILDRHQPSNRSQDMKTNTAKKNSSPAGKRWSRHVEECIDGSLLGKERPAGALPTLVKPGQMIQDEDGGAMEIILTMQDYLVAQNSQGQTVIRRWGEVLLDYLRPDPAHVTKLPPLQPA